MIRGMTNKITPIRQKGYPSRKNTISRDTLLGFYTECNTHQKNCVVLIPGNYGTERSKNNEGCQSKKMYTTNDTPMGSNKKTSQILTRQNRLKTARQWTHVLNYISMN